jgi:hypothetical protein
MTPEIISQWPKTVEQAVERVIATLTAEQKERVRQTPEDQLPRYHQNMGRWIRNMFRLWGGNNASSTEWGGNTRMRRRSSLSGQYGGDYKR